MGSIDEVLMLASDSLYHVLAFRINYSWIGFFQLIRVVSCCHVLPRREVVYPASTLTVWLLLTA